MIFIRNLFKNDDLFIQAASRFGYKICANTSNNDEEETRELINRYPEVNIINSKTAFQKKKPFWITLIKNHFSIELFRLKNRPLFEFRNSKYFEINFLSALIGTFFSFLRPYIRFQHFNLDKDLYLKKLKNSGLPIPEIYAILRDNQEPDAQFLKKIKYPCICKPSSCSGSTGVYLANQPEDIIKLYSYEHNPESLSELSLYYRNKTSKGVRNYIYNSHTLGGRYLFQEYVHGRVFSISAALVKQKLISPFCYEIQSADHVYFAEQGFSWPIDQTVEKQMIELTQKLSKVLNYPDGPLMADMICDQNGKLHIIDAGPRASLTAAKLSHMVYQDNWHAECLILAPHEKSLMNPPLRKGRPIHWQRLALPKGEYKSIQYPDMNRSAIVFYDLPVKSGSKIFESRTDRQMIDRGEFATTGESVADAKIQWQNLFKEFNWILKS